MLPLRYLEILADRLASAPVFSITSHGGLPPLIGGVVVLIGFAWIVRGGRIPKILVLAGVLLTPALVWSTALGTGPASGLEIHFFDVGQGDGALISSPAGANILVDGGPDEEQMATKLAALGVKRLDVVIGTHPHADHLDGLPEVFARFPVGTVLEPGCNEPSPSYTAFKESIALEGLHVDYPRAGDELQVGDLTLDFLAPHGCFSDTHSDPNNDSLVFRLTLGDDSVLFSGDAEIESQQVMLDDHALLQSEVLKVPHHGGDTSLPEFFDAVRPQLAIVSVGQPNPYGHPVPKVLDELAATGAHVVRTDQAGDLDVVFDRGRLLVDSEAA
jgi:competence protein ComEC